MLMKAAPKTTDFLSTNQPVRRKGLAALLAELKCPSTAVGCPKQLLRLSPNRGIENHQTSHSH
jgi:hypothetical protein